MSSVKIQKLDLDAPLKTISKLELRFSKANAFCLDTRIILKIYLL